MLDASAFRQVMGAYPTGVTVVTALDRAGAPVGLTVNSFTSVSLDPPLVLVCIDRGAASHDVLLAAGGFSVNVLAAEQEALAVRFASDPSEGRFDAVAWKAGGTGAPVLEGTVAGLDCTVESVHPGGDHSIVVGRVHALRGGDGPALVFHRGAFGASGA